MCWRFVWAAPVEQAVLHDLAQHAGLCRQDHGHSRMANIVRLTVQPVHADGVAADALEPDVQIRLLGIPSDDHVERAALGGDQRHAPALAGKVSVSRGCGPFGTPGDEERRRLRRRDGQRAVGHAALRMKLTQQRIGLQAGSFVRIEPEGGAERLTPPAAPSRLRRCSARYSIVRSKSDLSMRPIIGNPGY